ncbi:response regulator, partial [candidate division KSB3 bacterium]|nr:response regulator [candidate division KSB3 bacterium]MBD3324920.1 response regulator [candidate division KSB3 bacterium]
MDQETRIGGKILIIDDNPDNLRILTDYLQNEGFHIFIAQSGEDALQQ